MANDVIWLRIAVPDGALPALQQQFAGVEFVTGTPPEDVLVRVTAVFTDRPLADDLAARLPSLAWLHVSRGGAVAFLTPLIRARPVRVTTSRGIHGPSFSEFALACVLAFAKQLPEVLAL